jgi:type IV secretory pathway VirJ component
MKIKKPLFAYLLSSLIVLSLGLLSYLKPPILQKIINHDSFGDINIAQPAWDPQRLVVVFADTQKFPAKTMAQQLATTGVIAAVIDSSRFFNSFTTKTGQCFDATQVTTLITSLNKVLDISSVIPLIVAGIADGALIPFVNAQTANNTSNLSIGFSVIPPADLLLCPPLFHQHHNRHLLSSNGLKSNWRAVWTDEPPTETAIFIKTLGNVDTRIAAYDTPLDTLLLNEVKINITPDPVLPMPVVEVPVSQSSDNATIFYSGDGGWRDLDRTVAGDMASLNYPVVGVDVLRYFWEHKTPQQAAADLSATMAYYRKNWGTKSFVLTGYSFGADILPALYNRLSEQDKNSIKLLVLLAPSKDADFEIHVSGWLGKSGGEQPLAPELAQVPKAKILCIYGKDEKSETACTSLQHSEANILELSGGHHFDEDYPKLTRQILEVYRQHGLN